MRLLRRPFTHPTYEQRPADPDLARIAPDEVWSAARIEAADQEIQVRRTARRVIRQLLPLASDISAPGYDLDLTSAGLEYLNLRGRRIGRLTIRDARCYGVTRPSGLVVSGPALLSRATFHGRTELDGSRFDGGLSLRGAELAGRTQTTGTDVARFADLLTRRPVDQVGELAVRPGTELKVDPGAGWTVRPSVAGHPVPVAES